MHYVRTSQPAVHLASHHLTAPEVSWKSLGDELEARGLEPLGHTVRLARLVESIGTMLNMDEDQLETLLQAAYLHDIGKLVLPEAVLLKPAVLDAEEWEVVKTHTHWSRVMVSGIPNLSSDTAAAVLYHHERWDGSGYPHGLRGEMIPLEARILAVCDVYDTLLSNRAYGRAWSPSSALQELQSKRGSQFDPTVVDAFLDRVLGKMTTGG
jgi:HD-GYP domain-containing protein (c-di-GMP phosphodiesterase class II)